MTAVHPRDEQPKGTCRSDPPLVVKDWWSALTKLDAYESRCPCFGRPRSEEPNRRAIRIEHVKGRAVRAAVNDVTHSTAEGRGSCLHRLQLDEILNAQ